MVNGSQWPALLEAIDHLDGRALQGDLLRLSQWQLKAAIFTAFIEAGGSAFAEDFWSTLTSSPSSLRGELVREFEVALTDARDADLSGLAQVSVSSLTNVVWSERTMWPPELEHDVIESSRPVPGRPGEHVIDPRGRSYDDAELRAPSWS